jgi:hypothetical protein
MSKSMRPRRNRFNLTGAERAVFDRLSTPAKIQDYLNALPINFEPNGDTCRSPHEVLQTQRAHCLEGALFAAAVLWYHGQAPLLLDLKAAAHDYDHVVTLFKQHGRWGAISKTNHAVLRYREPVYATVRELALSYFHEYFDHSGKKTLRSFSKPFSLKRFGTSWITDSDDLWEIGAALDDAPHVSIASASQFKTLRRADPLEIEAGKLTEYKEKA